jgi:hypothetical protein
MASTIANGYRSVNREMAWKLFNGEDTSTLDKLIRDGNSATLVDVDPAWVEDTFYQSIMATVIPISWRTNSERRVFIMTGEGLPGSGCTSDPSEAFDSSVWEPSYSCIDGESYWVVSFSVDCRRTNQQLCVRPSYRRFLAAPGWETIDGKNWGGLKKEKLLRR